ncbi:MAG: poly-gamma-glutamate system protein [candidate division WOR-3 bacterium]|nr:poly-gamma-glutamate system protein [candidate division WOR-3 bacterium]MCX7836428.1 poly-gamma-glutamate system protein [candidate division WOR-3 bacterium]MDW8113745.1 poly-gamma-glutamate system protein [candidate division WOR-3 bacterium]
MRKRIGKVGRSVLIIYAFLAILFFFILTLTVREEKSKYYEEKVKAVKKTKEALEIIKNYRIDYGIPIDIINDPKETGLIFHPYSILTYERTNLTLSQASLSPNFSAFFIELLKDKKLKENDTIILFLDGSFPALNISLLSALEVLRIRPIIFLQVASISYGANDPNFTFLEIFKILKDNKIFDFTLEYASLGGKKDIGEGLSKEAREFIKEKINYYKIKPIIAENESLQILLKKDLLKNFNYKGIIALSYDLPFKEKDKKRFFYHFNNPFILKEEYDIKDELFKGRLFYEKRYSLFYTSLFLIILIFLLYLIIKYDLEYYLTKKKEEIYEEGI